MVVSEGAKQVGRVVRDIVVEPWLLLPRAYMVDKILKGVEERDIDKALEGTVGLMATVSPKAALRTGEKLAAVDEVRKVVGKRLGVARRLGGLIKS